MDDKTLRSKLIRLAYQRPELRPEILPLVAPRGQKQAARFDSPLYQEVMPAVLDHVESAQAVTKEVARISDLYEQVRTLAHRQKWTEAKRLLEKLSKMLPVVTSDMGRLAGEATLYARRISQEGA